METKHKAATIAAARCLCNRHADVCGTNAQDEWFLYSEDFTADAQAALQAAGVPDLLEALQAICEELEDGNDFEARQVARFAGRAAIAKATGTTHD